jgi:hypothetical protein
VTTSATSATANDPNFLDDGNGHCIACEVVASFMSIGSDDLSYDDALAIVSKAAHDENS